MTIVKHELKQGAKAFAIWTLAIGFLLAVSIVLFPEMKEQMAQAGNMFASMGSFTAAFGMDRLDFSVYKGYYAVECANVLGMGGAFFSSLIAVSILSKEERDKTAEFLFTHPVSRVRILNEKLSSLVIRVLLMNLCIFALSLGMTALIGEQIFWKEMILLHLAFTLMQLELTGICFGISAFMTRGSLGVGLGLAAIMYFLNIISNLADSVSFLKYVTPFGYCEGGDIVNDGLDAIKILIGLTFGALGIAAAYGKYTRKDIRA